jgi:hypothetical protein
MARRVRILSLSTVSTAPAGPARAGVVVSIADSLRSRITEFLPVALLGRASSLPGFLRVSLMGVREPSASELPAGNRAFGTPDRN